MRLKWDNLSKLFRKEFVCGWCGLEIFSEMGFIGTNENSNLPVKAYVCTNCGGLNYFDQEGFQYPGPMFGSNLKDIMDKSIKNLYQEARKCYSNNAYSASVLCSRKLIINYAKLMGSQDSVSFISSLDYLFENNYVQANTDELIKNIKVREYPIKEFKISDKKEAEEMITFSEMLIRFNSEFEVKSNMNHWQFLYRALKSHREDLKKIIECKTFDSFKTLFEELLSKIGISIFKLNNRTFYPYQIYGDRYSNYPDRVTWYIVYLVDADSKDQISDLEKLINKIVEEIEQDNFSQNLTLNDLVEPLEVPKDLNIKNIRLADLLGEKISERKSFGNKYAIVSSKNINLELNSRLKKIIDDYEIEWISLPRFYDSEEF